MHFGLFDQQLTSLCLWECDGGCQRCVFCPLWSSAFPPPPIAKSVNPEGERKVSVCMFYNPPYNRSFIHTKTVITYLVFVDFRPQLLHVAHCLRYLGLQAGGISHLWILLVHVLHLVQGISERRRTNTQRLWDGRAITRRSWVKIEEQHKRIHAGFARSESDSSG